ncbi:unnamed protein product [Choristocarpus tenellus]
MPVAAPVAPQQTPVDLLGEPVLGGIGEEAGTGAGAGEVTSPPTTAADLSSLLAPEPPSFNVYDKEGLVIMFELSKPLVGIDISRTNIKATFRNAGPK